MIISFGDIDQIGYLDRLYVNKDSQNKGVATAICDKLESEVKVACVTVHASITAKPFFEKRGYKILKMQEVEREGVCLSVSIQQTPYFPL